MSVNIKNHKAPSASPEKPKAKLLGIAEELARLSEVSEQDLMHAERMAEKIFDFLIEASDKDVFGGTIQYDEKDEELKPYVDALNEFFPLVRDPETGAVRQLSPESVKEISHKAYMKVAAFGGVPHVKFSCDIVNQEASERIPSGHVYGGHRGIKVSQAFSSHDPHSVPLPA